MSKCTKCGALHILKRELCDGCYVKELEAALNSQITDTALAEVKCEELEAQVRFLKVGEALHKVCIQQRNAEIKRADKAEAQLAEIAEKRKSGWDGFQNVMYGWCVPLSQINEFFDAILNREKS